MNALRKSPQLAPPTRGTWRQDSEFLQRYAADIDIQGQVASTETSHSVPSVFQRPIQFYRSLASSNHPLNNAVTQEWRGLMAVFALAGWLELQLEPRRFTVPPAPTREEDGARTTTSEVGKTGNGSLHLDTIIRNQAPDSQDWAEWSMIYCDGSLLGATSPWTVVYTASQYKASESIPWQRDGHLIDPIKYYDPDEERLPYELAILYAWVNLTLSRRGQWQMPARLGVQGNVIADALQAWKTDLARYADRALTQSFVFNGSLFTEPMLAGILQQPADLEGGHSDLLLRPATLDDWPVVVLSTQLPPDRRIYRGVFVRDVDIASLDSCGHGFITRSGRRCDVDYVVAEKLFLPDRLVELQYSSFAYQPSSLQLSAPLTPAFFRYFDHLEFVSDPSRLAISKIGQSFKVALRLPVSGGALTVERTYTEQEVVRLPSKTPGFAVWPDFSTPEWKENFAAYAGPEGSDLVVTPVFSNADQPGDQARSDAHQKNVRIWPCEKPCIGFALKLRNGASGDIDAGLVLRKDLTPPMPRNDGLTWQMGVDFGTSSTTIMVSRNGAPPDLMLLKGRTVFLTEPESEASGSIGAIESSLYPSAKTVPPPPFRTLLYDSAATVFKMRASNYTLRFAGDAAADGTNRPLRNVKWGHQPADDGKSPMMAYLESLVRYLACEALAAGVHNLDLLWSYPLSLPDGAFSKMQSFWTHQVARRYSVTNGMTVRVAGKMSESEAICRCLGAPRQSPILDIRSDCLSIAVDMGGGSTDIAMWSAQTLLDQYSFKIAGNDILDEHYLRPESVQAIFEACRKKSIPPEQIKNILGSPEVYVNGALTGARNETGSIHDPHNHPLPMYIHGGHEDMVPWLHFRSMNYLCFAGLAYYLGTHTRIFDLNLEDIEVYIGGRGSAGLTWLAADPAIARELLTDAFRQGLNSNIKIGEDDPVRFRHRESAKIKFLGSAIEYQSNYPPLKTEVASGLLADLKLVVNPEQGVRLGEVGWRSKNNQQSEPWKQHFTAKDMADLNPPQDFESSHISDFLTWLRKDNKRFLTRLNLDADNLKQLWPQKTSIQNQIRGSADEENHVLQPIFGFEIKSLMQQYAQLVSQSAGARKAI